MGLVWRLVQRTVAALGRVTTRELNVTLHMAGKTQYKNQDEKKLGLGAFHASRHFFFHGN